MKTPKSTDKLLEKILNMLEKEVPYKNDLKICGVIALTLDMQKTTVLHINSILMRPILNSDEENEQYALAELSANFNSTETNISHQQDGDFSANFNCTETNFAHQQDGNFSKTSNEFVDTQICETSNNSSFPNDSVSNASELIGDPQKNVNKNIHENSMYDETNVVKYSNKNLLSSENNQNSTIENVNCDVSKSTFPSTTPKTPSNKPDETLTDQHSTNKNIGTPDENLCNHTEENNCQNTENTNFSDNLTDNFEADKTPAETDGNSNLLDSHFSKKNDDTPYSETSNVETLNKNDDTMRAETLNNLFDGIIAFEDSSKVSENVSDGNNSINQTELFSNEKDLVDEQNTKEDEKLEENNTDLNSTNNTDKNIENDNNFEKNTETSKSSDVDQILMDNTSIVSDLYNTQTHCIEIKPDNMTDQSNSNQLSVSSSYSTTSYDIRRESNHTNTFSSTTFNKDSKLVTVSSKSDNNQSVQSNECLNQVENNDLNGGDDYCQENDFRDFRQNPQFVEQKNEVNYNEGRLNRNYQVPNISTKSNNAEAELEEDFTDPNDGAFYRNDEYDGEMRGFKEESHASFNTDEVIEIDSDEDNTNPEYTYGTADPVEQKQVQVFQRPPQPNQMQLVSYNPSPQKRFKMNLPPSPARFQRPQHPTIPQQRRLNPHQQQNINQQQYYTQQQNINQQHHYLQQNMPRQQRKSNEVDRPPNNRGRVAMKKNGKGNHRFIPESFASDRNMTVLQRFSCNLCGNVYQNYFSVLRHQTNVHGRPKKYNKRSNNNEEYYEDGSNEEDPAPFEGDYQY